jgi:hypothetical protein
VDFEDACVLSDNRGVVISVGNGQEFQLTIVESTRRKAETLAGSSRRASLGGGSPGLTMAANSIRITRSSTMSKKSSKSKALPGSDGFTDALSSCSRALKAVNRRVEFEFQTGVSDRTDLRTGARGRRSGVQK